MNGVDLAVLAVAAFSGVLGFLRGVVREIFGLAAWIGATVAAIFFYDSADRVARHSIANPDIADVTVIDSHTVYIVGKGFGNSSVIITDQMGRPLFDGEVVVTASQKGAITIYKGLTPSLMVCSTVCTPEGSGNSNAGTASPVALGAPLAASAGNP